MSDTVNTVVTLNNKVKYSAVTNPLNGINYLNGNFASEQTYYYNNTQAGRVYSDIIRSNRKCNCVVNHITGTINRKDLTDDTWYYQIYNDYPAIDQMTVIPANKYTRDTVIDYFEINCYKETNFACFRLHILPVNNDNKFIENRLYTYKFTVTQYCL